MPQPAEDVSSEVQKSKLQVASLRYLPLVQDVLPKDEVENGHFKNGE